MKKLMMFAAAMTIVGGAYASCADPEVGECAYVYDLKISIKTTGPLAGEAVSVPCGDDIAAGCYRKIGKASLKGYIYTCDCTCEDMKSGTLILWDTKAKDYVIEEGALTWEILSTIGKSNKDAEGYWTLETDGATLAAAGFGKWDQKADRLSSMSGNIVGKLVAPECEGDAECVASVSFPCNLEAAEEQTIGYGTWSIKYNSSKSKEYAQTGTFDLPY